jgi:methionyl-tRNA formyltransferase
MRFAITGVDRSIPVLEALIAAGWEPVKLFTMPVDGYFEQNDQIVARAAALGIPVQLSRMSDDDLRELGARGCDVLVVATYNWRIGDWTPYLRYAINFHPSLLPEARGPYPMIQAILGRESHWGVTCHRLSPAFDEGEILAQSAFALQPDETLDSLNLKIEMTIARLASRVARDLPALWVRARPQQGGSYWPRITDAQRTIDFGAGVEAILRLVRACGMFECKARIDGRTVYVRRAAGWTESHAHAPGTVVHVQARKMVVAVADGYVALLEWSVLEPGGERRVGR